MSDVNPVPVKHPVPHLMVDGAAEAIEFYKKAFGAEEIMRMPAPDGKRLMHAQIKIDDDFYYLADDFPEFTNGKISNPKALKGSSITIHRFVQDCDAAVAKAEAAGATVVYKPQDMFWGDRYAKIVDPFGHEWAFATHIRDMTPGEMIEAAKQAMGS